MTFFTETVCVILESIVKNSAKACIGNRASLLLYGAILQEICHDIYSSLEYSFKIGSYKGPSRKPVVTLKLVSALTSAETFPTGSL